MRYWATYFLYFSSLVVCLYSFAQGITPTGVYLQDAEPSSHFDSALSLLDGNRDLSLFGHHGPAIKNEKEEAKIIRLFKTLYTHGDKSKSEKELVLDSLELLEKYKQKTGFYHFLTSYIFAKVTDQTLKDASAREQVSKFLKETDYSDCAQKDLIDRTLPFSEDSKILPRLELLKKVHQFNDKEFVVDRSIKIFLQLTPDEKSKMLSHLGDQLRWQNLPINKVEWLVPDSMKEQAREILKLQLLNQKISGLMREGQCDRSKQVFLGDLPTITPSKKNLEYSINQANKIGLCFKSKSNFQRISFWRQLRKEFQTPFGFDGEAAATLAFARILWNDDRFNEAYAEVNHIIETSRKMKATSILAKSMQLKADILDNQGDDQGALQLNEQVIQTSPKSEEAAKSLLSLILSHIKEKNWDKVGALSEQLVSLQDDLFYDQKDESLLGFSLLWLARSKIAHNDIQSGVIYLERLARELYSTFYGALGHYLYEQLTQNPLTPGLNASYVFDEENLFLSFDFNGQQKIKRINFLDTEKLSDNAYCELKELPVDLNNPNQVLTQAMLYYSRGEWLDAIKTYGILPRSYRNSLPNWFEKILFPKRFDAIITKYANRLNLDPYLAYALIRQESVFNPEAQSPVGAKGLMQVMPTTAIGEIKLMKSDYVDAKELSHLIKTVRAPRGLFDVETNVAIGMSHLKRLLNNYKDGLVYSLAAYNAGALPLSKWVKRYPTDDVLYFIEKIPFAETKGYVKVILRNYFYYKRWYSDKKKLDYPHLKMVTKGFNPKIG